MLLRSIKVTAPGLKDKIINNLVWSVINVLIFTYIMPSNNPEVTFGALMAVAAPITTCIFSSVSGMLVLLTEITQEGTHLQYELTLPMKQSTVFVKYALQFAYESFITSLLVLPIIKILLWNQIPLESFCFFKFHLILLMTSIFGGFFGIFVVSITKDMYSGYDNISTRIIFPLWFLGGFQFSWQSLYNISPMLANLNLFNPFTYAFEGCRAAGLNPNVSLPYWCCFFALLFFTFIFAFFGIKNLKKRLDCL